MSLTALFQTKKPTLVVLSQVYVPDPAAVGQYMHDVAAEMGRRGWHVVVITSDHGYEEPSQRYPQHEEIEGVHVLRVPFSSFGKGSIKRRLAGGGIFVSEATMLAAALPRIDRILVSTSPPMCPLAGVALKRLRGAPLLIWTMDINPDQIVATGALAADALPVRLFGWMNRFTLGEASRVITLDRFMAARLSSKLDLQDKISVLPLWPQVDLSASALAHADNPFRREHGFGDSRVVMYSGNLSPVHSVQSCLEAAVALREHARLLFVFVGGGLGRQAIERYVAEHSLDNVRFLPYQPLSRLPWSLAAADLHLVSMGDAMVGIVHPSKVYSAMAVSRPVLAIGPRESHIGDLVEHHSIGWRVDQNDTAGTVAALKQFLAAHPSELEAMGARAAREVAGRFERSVLLSRFCEQLEVMH